MATLTNLTTTVREVLSQHYERADDGAWGSPGTYFEAREWDEFAPDDHAAITKLVDDLARERDALWGVRGALEDTLHQIVRDRHDPAKVLAHITAALGLSPEAVARIDSGEAGI